METVSFSWQSCSMSNVLDSVAGDRQSRTDTVTQQTVVGNSSVTLASTPSPAFWVTASSVWTIWSQWTSALNLSQGRTVRKASCDISMSLTATMAVSFPPSVELGWHLCREHGRKCSTAGLYPRPLLYSLLLIRGLIKLPRLSVSWTILLFQSSE